MNNIDWLFGATLGKARKQLIINKIVLRSSSVITKGIEQIYKDTKSKRKPNERASSSALQEEEAAGGGGKARRGRGGGSQIGRVDTF